MDFGGPQVHYQIFHSRFVDGLRKTPWIDDSVTYHNILNILGIRNIQPEEVFVLTQALPGPASNKMTLTIR